MNVGVVVNPEGAPAMPQARTSDKRTLRRFVYSEEPVREVLTIPTAIQEHGRWEYHQKRRSHYVMRPKHQLLAAQYRANVYWVSLCK